MDTNLHHLDVLIRHEETLKIQVAPLPEGYKESKLRLLRVHQVSLRSKSEFETNMKKALMRKNGLVRTVPGYNRIEI